MNIERPLFKAGDRVLFNYPIGFKTLPDYSARRGHIMTVIGMLSAEENDCDEDMFHVEDKDGWLGHAFESELELAGKGE